MMSCHVWTAAYVYPVRVSVAPETLTLSTVRLAWVVVETQSMVLSTCDVSIDITNPLNNPAPVASPGVGIADVS